ncbi:MAG TPA: HDOD domain-containing protein [Gammaproteobacteria bacterium]|nr:HDOD domain-containing protein [Gammaproteobacteria bacterium]
MLLLRGFLFVVVIAALAVVMLSLLRRTPRPKTREPEVDPNPARDDEAHPAARAVPPVPATPPSKALERGEVFRKLHELALGAPIGAPPAVPADAKIDEAVATVLETAATEPRYAPRRPMLLPQLLNAVGDGDTSRAELARMIARDPALVGSLLRLANSSVYRRTAQPVESVERAVTVMGTQGIRSLIAAALVQPVFRTSGGQGGKFPEVVWDHTYRAAAAAEVHALAEGADAFAAQLLALVTGLAALVVFRVASDQYGQRAASSRDAAAIAALLDEHTAEVALRIAASWELSPEFLEALEGQLRGKPALPASALGRSLKFGLVAGALAVLASNDAIGSDTGLASLVAAGGIGSKYERLWARFTAREEDDAA